MAPAILTDDASGSPVGAKPKPTIYLTDNFHPEVMKFLNANCNPIRIGTPGSENWRAEAKFLLVRAAYVTRDDILQCPNLLAIGKQGVGIDKIDAAACKERGIPIFNTPGVNARAVAELVLSLTMSVARCVGRIATTQNAGKLVPKETCSGLIMNKRTLGLVGMGNIGRSVADIFRGAFDSPIIAYDPFLPADAWVAEYGGSDGTKFTRATSVDEVLQNADVISLHVPLTDGTRNMVALPQMRAMKREAIIVNAARGGIVNEADLEVAVREGLIWGAGLDCHEQEPPSKDKYGALWGGEYNIVSTPHIGAATAQTQMETGMVAAQKLLEFALSVEK